MSDNKKKKPFLEEIEVVDIGAEGKAIAKVDEKILFLSHCIPGDIVDVQVTKKRKNFLEGYVVRFHEHSNQKIKPVCPHFGSCGGCKWQMLPYEEQLKFKQKQVADQLSRIGKLNLPVLQSIIPSSKTLHYRNKLEFTFSNKRWLTREEIDSGHIAKDRDGLGFHMPGMFDKVLDIEECFLQKEPSNDIRQEIKKFAIENKLSFFDIRKQEGFLRNLIIRTSSRGEVMVIVVFHDKDHEKRKLILHHVYNNFPMINSLMYIVNQKANDSIFDQEIKIFRGRDYIVEELDGLKFRIGPKSFFQTNTSQAVELYKIIVTFAELTGKEIVYDLYSGTGSITNFVARNCKKVIGIEFIEEATEDAKINSELNNIHNTEFFTGDMKDLLTEKFINEHGKPDVIILDPPRAGVHPNVIDILLMTGTDKIIYVSCNPATQARDVQLLSEKYFIDKVQPIDMFPHTHHVENVISLVIK